MEVRDDMVDTLLFDVLLDTRIQSNMVPRNPPPHRVLQDPVPYPSNDVAAWSYQLTSLRKDVECTFGIIKIRWRILKVPQVWKYRRTMDDVFCTCCWLHNFLHDRNNCGAK